MEINVRRWMLLSWFLFGIICACSVVLYLVVPESIPGTARHVLAITSGGLKDVVVSTSRLYVALEIPLLVLGFYAVCRLFIRRVLVAKGTTVQWSVGTQTGIRFVTPTMKRNLILGAARLFRDRNLALANIDAYRETVFTRMILILTLVTGVVLSIAAIISAMLHHGDPYVWLYPRTNEGVITSLGLLIVILYLTRRLREYLR